MTEADEPERHRIETFEKMEALLMEALAAGNTEATLTLNVHRWLSFLDEVRDRHPRNYSRLVADDTIARLNDAIDRIHGEANYLAAFSSGSVADHFAGKPPPMRQAASPELMRAMREKRDGQS